jgi:hypothetical protein
MIKNIKERENKTSFYPPLLNILIIVIIIAVGLFAINQYLNYKFKAQLLNSPCELCYNQNENIQKCFKENNFLYQEINLTNINFSLV